MGQIALSVADLSIIRPEPRLRDLTLAELLGFEQPYSIRKLINRNLDEMALHGEVVSTAEKTSAHGGRPGAAYLLNEGQSLVVCMLSRTPRAAQVRKQVIDVFMAWRHGRQPEPTGAIATKPEWNDLRGRLLEFEASPRVNRIAALLQAKRIRRMRPIWRDTPVRNAAIALHREVTLDEARLAIADKFGPARAPSRSALQRFWRDVDTVLDGNI